MFAAYAMPLYGRSMQPDDALAHLIDFLRFPSISTEPAHAPDMRACAEWLSELLGSNGFQSHVRETGGHPLVIARNPPEPGRRTVLIYGHYDVQPVDPLELWTSPPFEPRVEGDVITARGATDNKGQILSHVLGAIEMLRSSLPVNVIFLIEGEEEVGSPNLEQFLKSHHEELRCDVVAISDTGMLAPGVPTMTYGLRGVAAAELVVEGPAVDLHSGLFGGAVANPLTMLARMLATLHDSEGRVAVEGFYDAVRGIESWEREVWSRLGHDADLLQVSGVSALVGEPEFTPTERVWARPTVELNGLGGGYQGPGSKTVIPASAFAKITCRLVPDQAPEDVLELLERHFARVAPQGVRWRLDKGHSGKPYFMDPGSSYGKAAQAALRETFQSEPVLIREGGSIPIVQTFKECFGVDCLLLGLALTDANIHSPNERFSITNFHAGRKLNQALLRRLAEV